jgi:hypothetical protein
VERLSRWARSVQGIAESIAKTLIIAVVLWSMLVIGRHADPGTSVPTCDRILSWSFVVFAVGLAELFVLFVIMTVLGKIDLARAFYEKSEEVSATPVEVNGVVGAQSTGVATDASSPASPNKNPRRGRTSKGAVSLSRLQAFMWTLIVITVYFHRVVKDHDNTLPAIPPELLMAMGISGAVYLASKGMASSDSKQTKEAKQ